MDVATGVINTNLPTFHTASKKVFQQGAQKPERGEVFWKFPKTTASWAYQPLGEAEPRSALLVRIAYTLGLCEHLGNPPSHPREGDDHEFKAWAQLCLLCTNERGLCSRTAGVPVPAPPFTSFAVSGERLHCPLLPCPPLESGDNTGTFLEGSSRELNEVTCANPLEQCLARGKC